MMLNIDGKNVKTGVRKNGDHLVHSDEAHVSLQTITHFHAVPHVHPAVLLVVVLLVDLVWVVLPSREIPDVQG